MRPFTLLILLLLLHLLLSGAYGARLGNFGIMKSATTQEKSSLDNNNPMKNSNSVINNNEAEKRELVEVVCKDEEHCASKGKNRKLVTSTTMSTFIPKPIQENAKNGPNKIDFTRGHKDKEESLVHSPSTVTQHNGHQKVVTPKKYEDVIDMNEMDYSPAKRKPPIHN